MDQTPIKLQWETGPHRRLQCYGRDFDQVDEDIIAIKTVYRLDPSETHRRHGLARKYRALYREYVRNNALAVGTCNPLKALYEGIPNFIDLGEFNSAI